jgi:hypothetical protein
MTASNILRQFWDWNYKGFPFTPETARPLWRCITVYVELTCRYTQVPCSGQIPVTVSRCVPKNRGLALLLWSWMQHSTDSLEMSPWSNSALSTKYGNKSTRCELPAWRFKQWQSNSLPLNKFTALGNVPKNVEFWILLRWSRKGVWVATCRKNGQEKYIDSFSR